MRYEISATVPLEAAHSLDMAGNPAHNRQIHGHSFLVTAVVAADALNDKGWIVSLEKLESALREALAPLEHQLLNDVEGLGPSTMENIMTFVAGRMEKAGFAVSRMEIERPTLRQKAAFHPGR
jgi:6-pyruvoyltetrahydropterin/6-carboxytetrahydropterin synthase